jgi:hypothetical protein
MINFIILLPNKPTTDALVREFKILDPFCKGLIPTIWCPIHGLLVWCSAVWLSRACWNLPVWRSSWRWYYEAWSSCIRRWITLILACWVTRLNRIPWLSSVVTLLIWKYHTELIQFPSPAYFSFPTCLTYHASLAGEKLLINYPYTDTHVRNTVL